MGRILSLAFIVILMTSQIVNAGSSLTPAFQPGPCPTYYDYSPLYSFGGSSTSMSAGTYQLYAYTKDIDSFYNLIKSFFSIDFGCIKFTFAASTSPQGITVGLSFGGTTIIPSTTYACTKNYCLITLALGGINYSVPVYLVYAETGIVVLKTCFSSIGAIVD